MPNPTKQKDQFVVAYITDPVHSEIVVSHATHLATMLKKGLILLHISDPRYTKLSTDDAGAMLKSLQSDLLQQGHPHVTYAALKGETKPIIDALPVLLNAVVAVAQVDSQAGRHAPTHKKELLRNFSECKIAFLTVQEALSDIGQTKHVAFSIDYRKESKEKLVWASYFARFNGSSLHSLYYDYTDEAIRYKWYSNMQFMHKFFTSLGISFVPHVLKKRTTFPDVSALDFANENGIGTFIAVTTNERDGIEFFIGVQEHRIMVNPHKTPVLFINPRDDIYVLCD